MVSTSRKFACHRSTVQAPPTGASVDYRIDFYDHNGAQTDNANNQFRRAGPSHAVPFGAEIPLQAGSDYATPENPFYYSQQWDGRDPANGASREYGRFHADYRDFNLEAQMTRQDKTISIVISNDTRVEFNEDLLVQLYFNGSDPQNPPARPIARSGFIQNCALTILFDDQPAGAVNRNHNPDSNANTDPAYNPHPGANATVFTTTRQPDGKTLLGGSFTAFNTRPRNRIARANIDGSNDAAFNPPGGADNFVSSIVLDPFGRIVTGGAFTSFNGVKRNGIARLNGDGTLDNTFNPGVGANGTVWCVALQPDGKVLIGGEFTSVNGTNCNYIARLGTNGVLDATFDSSTGPMDQC